MGTAARVAVSTFKSYTEIKTKEKDGEKMPVRTYSLHTDGNIRLSPNFLVREFSCKDGSDKILIDDELVDILQKIRDHFGKPITINSGYRTARHNANNGGASSSQHLYGKATDTSVAGVTPLAVAQFAESLGVGGIGHAPAGQGNFVHIDTRTVKSRWEYCNGGKSTRAVAGFGGTSILPPASDAAISIEIKSIYVNGSEKKVRAGLIDEANYVNLRDLVIAMGGTVTYDDKNRQISITT